MDSAYLSFTDLLGQFVEPEQPPEPMPCTWRMIRLPRAMDRGFLGIDTQDQSVILSV